MDCFNYPLDTETLLRKKRRLRKELLAQNPPAAKAHRHPGWFHHQ